MKLNSKLSERAFVKYEDATWVPSPEPGVNRLMLERVGGEKVTRATTIVKYDPASQFPGHTHDGGEEFFVLDGVFSDATGDFCQGFYVRNPVGSRHTPWSKEGTTIFVKLGQIDAVDKTYVRLDTNGADWRRYPDQGFNVLQLHHFGNECTQLVFLERGRKFADEEFPGGVEMFLIDGCVEVSGKRLTTRDWLRAPAGSRFSILGKTSATFYMKTGHLFPVAGSDASP